MDNCNDIATYLLNNGLTNLDRLKNSLDPNSVSVMHLGVEEWAEFTHSFAQKVNYFNSDESTPSGDWQAFFEWARKNKGRLEEYDEGDASSHLTLFVAFLKLLNFSKDSLNQLTKRHLDFYYRDVLQLKNKPFQPDEVFTTFELNKNVDDFLIKKETALNGQKCDDGNIRNYKTYKDVVINKAEIAELKSIYRDDKGVYIKSTEEVNALNSIYPFGNNMNESGDYGFSLSSSELKLKEGEREITIVFVFDENVASEFSVAALGSLQLSYTSMEGWTDISSGDTTVLVAGNRVEITLALNTEMEGLVAPTCDVHEREHKYPLLKFLYKGEAGRKLFLTWSDLSLLNITIETLATYSENLVVKTDQGIIDPKNEFYPFSSLPKKGSKFSVHSDEWLDKNIITAEIQMQWKGMPDDFVKHYAGYYKEYFDENFEFKDHSPTTAKIDSNFPANNPGGDDYRFRTKVGKDDNVPNSLFYNRRVNSSGEEYYAYNFLYSSRYKPLSVDAYPFMLLLQEDFFHKDYPAITTIAVKYNELIPNPPYAPLADKVHVRITTRSTYSLSYKDVTLFHEYPYGHEEVKEFKQEFLPNLKGTFGECILGIDKFESNQLLNILFQLEEGTENPERATNNSRTYGWQYLSANQWVELSNDYVLENQIDHFLKSGLLTIKIPTFDHNNTILPAGKFWIRAFIRNHFETTSRIVGVHAQTILSRFQNNNNALSHLKDGLPSATIAKLINRQAQVKKIEQPYNSFNGKEAEDDIRFYRRISERLRHKDRCVCAWDYNHAILENFPFVHKVKTINHSIKNNYVLAGEVLVLIIPSMVNYKVFNTLKPMISRAKVNAIEKYVNARNSLHVDAKVISPTYIPIKIKARVKYHDAYDANYYNKQLHSDIVGLFAPWAFDSTVDIPLGGGIYYSQVVHYMEKLEYVDYIKDLKIYVGGREVRKFLPNNPMVVLTSVPAQEHEFVIIEKSICTP